MSPHEVLSSGRPAGNPVSRRPRALIGGAAGTAALCTVALLSTGVVSWPATRRTAGQSPSTPGPVTTTPEPSPEPSPQFETIAPTELPPETYDFRPDRYAAPLLRERTGIRLYVDGPTLIDYTVDSRRARTITGLPAEPDGIVFVVSATPVAGGTFVRVYEPDGDYPGPTAGVYAVRRGETRARRIGRATDVLPAADGRTAWLATVPENFPAGRATVERVDLTGRVVGQRRTLPAGYVPELVLADGLLLHAIGSDGDRRYVVWNPATGHSRPLRLDVQALAASGHSLISVDGTCDTRCSIHVTDVRNGHDRAYPLPAGMAPLSQAIDTGGTRLALALAPATHPNRGSYLAVLDLATGRLRTAGAVDGDAYPVVGWSAGGAWVTLLADTKRGRALAVWRPGDASPRLVTHDLPARTDILVD